MHSATFTISKKESLLVLKQIQKVEKAAKKKESIVKVTLKGGQINFSIPGVSLNVNAITNFDVSFTMSLWRLIDIIESEKTDLIHFSLDGDILSLRGFKFVVFPATLDESGSNIINSLNLNYSNVELAKFILLGKEDELTSTIPINKLNLKKALDSVNKDINSVIFILKKYGFSKAEVEKFIFQKVGYK